MAQVYCNIKSTWYKKLNKGEVAVDKINQRHPNDSVPLPKTLVMSVTFSK